ncbi:MAG TPA: GH32 C-terminal domain-containing protein [Victivallales bacterium]|nr:GH32 C-terminal domain-containing protein [Victivallales bacterium]
MGTGRDYHYGEIARVQGVTNILKEQTTVSPPISSSQLVVRESLISIQTLFASLHPDVQPRGPETGSFLMKPNETLKLRIFIDKSIVEVFANGKQCVAVRVYPSRDDSVGFSICSHGKDSELKSLEAWQMKNIYQD